MLFNSYQFILAFLPIVLMIFFFLKKKSKVFNKLSILWLISSSFFFYAFWKPHLLFLLIGSIGVNYLIARRLSEWKGRKRAVLIAGIGFNLSLLAFFKYAGFLTENVGFFLGIDIHFGAIVLPLAISFFTFQQIAYLVDVYNGTTHEPDVFRYALFVSFFPQMIAGPIVHHKEMIPQFDQQSSRIDFDDLATGITVFLIGLGKKALVADGIARYATPVFEAAEKGVAVTFFDAWGGILAYTFQIYFDFSGYCDMAIGLGLLFGIHLPLNFASPYRALSLIEFWRRWHMTLSRFLRQYLYYPLGGNQKGPARRYANMMIVMLLGGLWHGAGWTFIVWGGLHGLGLAVNHAWRAKRGNASLPPWLGWFLTFVFVSVAWVFFRADTFSGAMTVLAGLTGLNGIVLPETYAQYLGPVAEIARSFGIVFQEMRLFLGMRQVLALLGLLTVVLFLPNTQTWTRYCPPPGDAAPGEAGIIPDMSAWLRPLERSSNRAIVALVSSALAWRPNPYWAVAAAGLTVVWLVLINRAAEFIYFQF